MKIYAVSILDISEENLRSINLQISSENRYRIEKFIDKKDKIRTLIGEILIRVIITEQLGIRNKAIIFSKNQYGKPCLEKYQNFDFNISHSGDFVVCAINDKPIGIDIEQIKCIEYEEIAKSFFTVKEIEYITRNDCNSLSSKFYEIWTLKESYIKCCGNGLTIPLKSFSIEITKSNNVKAIIGNEQNEYVFKKIDIDSDYKLAICSLNGGIAKDIIKIDQNNLLNKYLKLNQE